MIKEKNFSFKFKQKISKWMNRVAKKDGGKDSQDKNKLDHYYTNISDIRDVIFIQDMALNVTFVSPSVKSVFGYTVEEALKLKMSEFMVPESIQKGIEDFQELVRLVEEKGDIDLPLSEYQYIRKDGSIFWGELKAAFLRDSNGRFIGIKGILRDIEKRKKVEDDLRQSELKFKTLFELSPQAIALTQLETGLLVDVNEKFCELTKLKKDEVIGKRITEIGFYSEENRKKLLNELRESGEVHGLNMDFRVKDGSILNAQMFSKLLNIDNHPLILTVFYDKTTEKRLEDQFLRAQKMEAVGNLASGIAHDFNNLLMGITGNVSLMMMNTDKHHPYYPKLQAIEHHALSCSKLTQQLLGYARKGKYEITQLDINEIIDQTIYSFQRTKKQITVYKDLSPDLMSVEADRTQIEQVLYNLYVNAADAMPKGGNIILKTSNVSDQDMKGNLYKPSKKLYVLIKIIDSGLGMDKYTLDNIFTPFFTTKGKGKGTGLGLASVYGIIKGHNGYIDVKSEQGKGTTFTIYLPASDRVVQKQDIRSPEIVHIKGTALLVDDEEDNLNVGSQMLEKIGFDVLKAKNGIEAIELYKKNREAINLVMLDVIMPGMDGGEVYDRIKEISPNVKVLLCSGYSLEGRAQEIFQHGCDGFLQKPFTIISLSQKVNEIFKIYN